MDDKDKEIARLRDHLERAGKLAIAARRLLGTRITNTDAVFSLVHALDEYDDEMMKDVK